MQDIAWLIGQQILFNILQNMGKWVVAVINTVIFMYGMYNHILLVVHFQKTSF